MLPANEQLPKVWLRSNRYLWDDGRLLLFAVTDLNDEADDSDHEYTKLE